MPKLPKRLSRATRVVLVCDGSDCRDNGSKKIRRALEKHLEASGTHKSVLLLKTKCTGNCKRGPICGFFPENEWLVEATPERACAMVDRDEQE